MVVEILALILVMIVSFAVIRGLAFVLKRTVTLRQKLFKRVPVQIVRLSAAVIALVFGLIFMIQVTYTDRYNLIFLIISVLALIYSIRRPQDMGEK